MKIWIIYDTKFGSNKRVATLVQELLASENEINISYAKDVSPKAVMKTHPQALIFGGPRRMGNISFTLRRWVERFSRILTSKGVKLEKIAAWETRGELKPESANSESKIERNIYEKNLKTIDLWHQLISKIPVIQTPQDLLSLNIIDETSLGNGKLEPNFEEKVRDFVQKFNT